MFVTVWNKTGNVESQQYYDSVKDITPYIAMLHRFRWIADGRDGEGYSDTNLRVRIQLCDKPERF